MNKMSGIVLLVIGLGLMLAAVFNLFQMNAGDGATTSLAPGWSTLRLVMLSLGALVGVFGCYSLLKKSAKPA